MSLREIKDLLDLLYAFADQHSGTAIVLVDPLCKLIDMLGKRTGSALLVEVIKHTLRSMNEQARDRLRLAILDCLSTAELSK